MAKREKSKAAVRQEIRKSIVQASLKGLTMSARKVRVVADLVRGVAVEQALTTLMFQPKAAARPLKKLLDSAIANAEKKGMDVDSLYVSEILVHGGPIRKRFMPRAQGRATPIRKRTAHVDVKLSAAK